MVVFGLSRAIVMQGGLVPYAAVFEVDKINNCQDYIYIYVKIIHGFD